MKNLKGESYFYYAPDLSVQMQYSKGNTWSVGVNAWNPFYKALVNKFETKSDLTHQFKKITYGDNGNLISIRFAYIFSFGRDYDTSSQKLNNNDSESGIMK